MAMEINKIMIELRELGYRVVPEYDSYRRNFEIIIEPWCWRSNRRKPGKIKKTGFIFNIYEINKKGESPYRQKLKEVQITLINHLKKKYETA